MKTLKKTLCLVLAVVLVVGTLILPAAADNAAAAPKVDADAEAAFKILQLYDVIKGVDKDQTPAYDSNVTRAEVAAIVYRIMTGDTLDTKVANYASHADVYNDKDAIPAWAKGYVGYVTYAKIFGGDSGNFNANAPVTGVQLVKVLLCCIGYGQNHEFEGKEWAQHTLDCADQAGLFGNLSEAANTPANLKTFVTSFDTGVACKRANVFKLTVNAVRAPRVSYYNGTYSYYKNDNSRPNVPNSDGTVANINSSLIVDTGNQGGDKGAQSQDGWGIPKFDAATATTRTITFNNPVKAVAKTLTIAAADKTSKILYDSFTKEDHCDIADEMGITASAKVKMKSYLNGRYLGIVELDPLDENTMIGEFGRHTLIYKNEGADKAAAPYIMVQIDTYLAVVTAVAASGNNYYDKNGHLITTTGTVPAASVALVDGAGSLYAVYNASIDASFKRGELILVNKYDANAETVALRDTIDKDPTPTAKTFVAPDAVASVKAKDITRGHELVAGVNEDTNIGFVSTDSKQYIYNITFIPENAKIEEANLNETVYSLYLDKNGYVLAALPLTNPDSGFGVITKSEVVQFTDKTWGFNVTMILPDSDYSVKTLSFGSAGLHGNGYADKATAEGNLSYFSVGSLIHYRKEKSNYFLDGAQIGNGGSIVANRKYSNPTITPNRPDLTDTFAIDAVRSDTAAVPDFIVDDSTVIFVAQYQIDNKTPENDYKFIGYLPVSFRDMPNLTVDGGVTAITGMGTTITDLTNLANVHVQAFTLVNGEPVAPTGGMVADIVVINGATKQIVTKNTIPVIDYAFIYGDTYIKQVGENYYTFNAFVNGKAQNITIALNTGKEIKENGLFSFGQPTNVFDAAGNILAYTEVTLLDGVKNNNAAMASPYKGDFKADAGTYDYWAGVLYVYDILHGNATYYTVAEDCKVYTVAPNPGDSRELTDGIGVLNIAYYAGKNIWYQLNQYGEISLVYIDLTK